MSHVLSNNKGGLSNRLKSIASCIRLAKFDLDYVCVEWIVISNYKKNKNILNCDYKCLLKSPKEYNNEDIKKKNSTERLHIKTDDNIPLNFPKFKSYCAKQLKEKPMSIDFEFLRIPNNVKSEYIKAFSKIELCDSLNTEVENYSKKFNSKTVSVHIRSWNRPNEQTRRSLHYKTKFLLEMKKFPDDFKFFLTSDSQKVLNFFTKECELKNRVITYPRRSNLDNSRDNQLGIQEDLIELYLLSKNKYLIGSHFSTYSEVAWWLGKCTNDIVII